MRVAIIAGMCAFAAGVNCQSLPPESNDKAGQSVQQALLGKWAGYLEYRDYSEPSTSTKRVQLPTWLDVTQTPAGLSLHYTYDDGPSKVVDETERLTLDLSRNTYTTEEVGHAAEVYRVDGFNSLREGRGTLVLTGSGTDNDKPAEQRITLSIRRNIVEWLLETRSSGSSDAFTFRHLYRFTRAQAPVITSPRK